MALPVDYINRFKQLKPKEKRLLGLLAMVVFGVMYFNLSVKPNSAKINDLKRQIEESKTRAKAFSKAPAPGSELAKELESLNTQIKTVKAGIAEAESKLLGESDVPRLLSELINCARGLGINFASVTQKMETDKGGMSKQLVNIKFEASYAQMLNYLRKISSVSDFVKIDEANIMRPKEGGGDIVTSAITLSALLSNAADARAQINSCGTLEGGLELAVSRNPFAAAISMEAQKPVKKPTFKLTGITYNDLGGASTAIINDTVLRKGDKVEGWTVTGISMNEVVLQGDGLTETLKVER